MLQGVFVNGEADQFELSVAGAVKAEGVARVYADALVGQAACDTDICVCDAVPINVDYIHLDWFISEVAWVYATAYVEIAGAAERNTLFALAAQVDLMRRDAKILVATVFEIAICDLGCHGFNPHF